MSCISVRSLSKISFLPPSLTCFSRKPAALGIAQVYLALLSLARFFGKRVQRYDLFLNWQSNSSFFFKKNKKNEQIGQKDEEKEEEKATHICILRSILANRGLTSNLQKATIMKNKDLWQDIIQVVVSILTAALTALGTTSCMKLVS